MRSLSQWLTQHRVPALYGLDTRLLTKKIREKGALKAYVEFEPNVVIGEKSKASLKPPASLLSLHPLSPPPSCLPLQPRLFRTQPIVTSLQHTFSPPSVPLTAASMDDLHLEH